MSKTSIGPPALYLERDLESQLEDVPMVEVIRAEDREADVTVDRRDGRRNDGGVTKQNTKTANRKPQEASKISSSKIAEKLPKPIKYIAKLLTTLISYTLTSLSSSTDVTYTCTM